MNKEHLRAYILCLKNNECYANFALRLRISIEEARKIARKLVTQSRTMLADYPTCVALGIPESHNQELRPLRRERRMSPDDLLAIKAGVMTLFEFYGIADDTGEQSRYVCDSIKI